MEAHPVGPTPAPVTALRWGLPDALIAWIVGVVCALLAVVPIAIVAASRAHVPESGIPEDLEVPALILGLVAQNLGIIGTLALIARSKGRGSLWADFGLSVRARDLAWIAAGLGLSLVAGWMLLPITELADLNGSSQEVVRQFENANGIEVPLFALGVVLLAPVAEELLFRGVLLRGLVRRTNPARAVFASALIFALVHVIGDPDTYYYVPAFLLLGLVSGWRAMKTGNLSQSVMLHMGFNFLASILIIS
ncbi:MAG: CPBP family intramembrane metalloprotease [Acidimicrobiia bacterium]|nr:CPBP family intramembrane metalloprotease [Acidimicrobiia bacterium]